jgi:hypothetical protein
LVLRMNEHPASYSTYRSARAYTTSPDRAVGPLLRESLSLRPQEAPIFIQPPKYLRRGENNPRYLAGKRWVALRSDHMRQHQQDDQHERHPKQPKYDRHVNLRNYQAELPSLTTCMR